MIKSVLITGASSGLGRELANTIAGNKDGMKLILTGRNRTELNRTERLCNRYPVETHLVVGDLASYNVRYRLNAMAHDNELDCLILCAGVYEHALQEEQRCTVGGIIGTNAIYPIELTQLIYKGMLERGSGCIVNINSIAGRTLSPPQEANYSASKHAMTAFMQSFRIEARAKGIRVLDVFLGAMQTPMCKDRPGYDKMMLPYTVASMIVANIMYNNVHPDCQLEELRIGRFAA